MSWMGMQGQGGQGGYSGQAHDQGGRTPGRGSSIVGAGLSLNLYPEEAEVGQKVELQFGGPGARALADQGCKVMCCFEPPGGGGQGFSVLQLGRSTVDLPAQSPMLGMTAVTDNLAVGWVEIPDLPASSFPLGQGQMMLPMSFSLQVAGGVGGIELPVKSLGVAPKLLVRLPGGVRPLGGGGAQGAVAGAAGQQGEGPSGAGIQQQGGGGQGQGRNPPQFAHYSGQPSHSGPGGGNPMGQAMSQPIDFSGMGSTPGQGGGDAQSQQVVDIQNSQLSHLLEQEIAAHQRALEQAKQAQAFLSQMHAQLAGNGGRPGQQYMSPEQFVAMQQGGGPDALGASGILSLLHHAAGGGGGGPGQGQMGPSGLRETRNKKIKKATQRRKTPIHNKRIAVRYLMGMQGSVTNKRWISVATSDQVNCELVRLCTRAEDAKSYLPEMEHKDWSSDGAAELFLSRFLSKVLGRPVEITQESRDTFLQRSPDHRSYEPSEYAQGLLKDTWFTANRAAAPAQDASLWRPQLFPPGGGGAASKPSKGGANKGDTTDNPLRPGSTGSGSGEVSSGGGSGSGSGSGGDGSGNDAGGSGSGGSPGPPGDGGSGGEGNGSGSGRDGREGSPASAPPPPDGLGTGSAREGGSLLITGIPSARDGSTDEGPIAAPTPASEAPHPPSSDGGGPVPSSSGGGGEAPGIPPPPLAPPGPAGEGTAGGGSSSGGSGAEAEGSAQPPPPPGSPPAAGGAAAQLP